jgi:hypothetical protein
MRELDMWKYLNWLWTKGWKYPNVVFLNMNVSIAHYKQMSHFEAVINIITHLDNGNRMQRYFMLD